MSNSQRYTVTKIAKQLCVTRQTIYYWVKKGWISPRRDYRNYPVFTEQDLARIKKWHNSVHETTRPAARPKQSEPPPNWKWGDLQNILYK